MQVNFDPHAEMRGKDERGAERRLYLLSAIFTSFFCLHHLRHEAAHGLCGLVLLLPCSVGVGAQGEARVVVSKHIADGFHVYAVLQCQRGECVSEVVKKNVPPAGLLQQPLQLLLPVIVRNVPLLLGALHLVGGAKGSRSILTAYFSALWIIFSLAILIWAN